MPAGYDAEVAELFRDLRSASGLSEADLAAQLATRTEVVQALEQGALYALPPWPETYRVVATYGTLLNLDVRPLLRRIYAQVDAGVVGLEPKAMPDVPFMAPPDHVEHEFQGQPAKSQPQAAESVPMPPRQPAPSPARPPQAAPERRGPGPLQAQAPQPRPQPQQPASAASAATATMGASAKGSAAGTSPRRRAAAAAAATVPQPGTAARSQGPVTAAAASGPARRCRCRRRPRKRNRRRSSGRGRRSSNGAWPRSSFWGSPPDYGYGLPSLVACSAPVRLPGSQAPNRPIRARQPPPIRTTRGAGRQTACPAPPN